MPRPEFGTLGDLAADGSGPEARLEHLEQIAVVVSGDHDGDVDIEVRLAADQDWTSIKTFTTNGLTGLFEMTFPVRDVRATLSSNTTGTAKIRYSGRDNDRAG